jgi:GDP-L-fucose synthase
MPAHPIPRDAAVYIAGHNGLVGWRCTRLKSLAANARREPAAAHLRDQAAELLVQGHRPEYVFLAAGTVGGILANSTRPAEFIYDNLMIHAMVIQASHEHSAKRLLYLGSSCIDPRDCAQPIKEEYLLSDRWSRRTSRMRS